MNGFEVYGYLIEEFGQTVAGIGDVNADGIDDVASGGVGVWPEPINCDIFPCHCVGTPGAVYVLFGRSGIGGTGQWNLQDLDETTGFRIEGFRPLGGAGYVSGAGDFNHDGISDFLIGAPRVDSVYASSGEAYMIFGTPGLGTDVPVNLSSLGAEYGFRMHGGFGWAGIGRRMASLGDFNGDGIDDVAVASPAPSFESAAGQVYVLYGGTGIEQLVSVALPQSLTPALGLKVYGIAPGDAFGSSIGGAGDVNGDGFRDLIVNASDAEPPVPNAEDQAYVIYGGPDVGGSDGVFAVASLDGSNGFTINGVPGTIPGQPTQLYGVAGVGDINVDGFDDVAVNVDFYAGNDWLAVVFGGSTVAPEGTFYLDSLDGANGFRVTPFGASAPAGDINADGFADLMSRTVVLFGGPGIGASGVIETSNILNGQDGLVLYLGLPLAHGGAGDVNADGIDDVIVGTKYFKGFPGCDVGKVDVFFGRRMGDSDLDADVDFLDFGAFQRCFRSEAMNTNPDGKPDVPDECHPFDFDKDNDVDLFDYAAFQKVLGS